MISGSGFCGTPARFRRLWAKEFLQIPIYALVGLLVLGFGPAHGLTKKLLYPPPPALTQLLTLLLLLRENGIHGPRRARKFG
jgi:hypothetical protein